MPSFHNSIFKRIFLVGCSRSGTTLLQVLIASHSRVYSLPETGYFIMSLGGRKQQLLAWLGLNPNAEHLARKYALSRTGKTDFGSDADTWPKALLFQTGVNYFVSALDQITLEAGKDIWLEKTPRHIFYIPHISRYTPQVHFIHIIRDGRDVVASIYDRAIKYSNIQNFGTQKDVGYGINLWNQALGVSMRYVNNPHHTLVSYEQLVQEPKVVLNRICNQIGIDYEPSMQEHGNEAAQKVILPEWGWVKGAMEPPKVKPSKFCQLFDEQQQETIAASLKLEEFKKLREAIICT
jgi:hypothetical protein